MTEDIFTKTFKQIISEANDEFTEDSVDLKDKGSSESANENLKPAVKPQEKPIQNRNESSSIKALSEIDNKNPEDEIKMKFSLDLISEFTRTVNEFTSICSKMVKAKEADKQTSDTFWDCYRKIKSLIEAAEKSV